MFEAFSEAFSLDAREPSGGAPETQVDASLVVLFRLYGGGSFEKGLYRVLSPRELGRWKARVEEAFPGYRDRVTCFGYDWLGGSFALDSGRLEAGQPGVVLFEPGTGEVLEIPCGLVAFHDEELVRNREKALVASFHAKWLASGGAIPHRGQCVGYRVPLFLGGKDDADNLEICDLDVYWEISTQLLKQTRGLPPGTRVGPARIEE